MQDRFQMACPCLFGLESLVAEELRTLGAENVAPENGRVLFTGGAALLARANIGLRCAERVLVLLGEFEAKTFDALFEGVKALPWEEWVGRDDAFPVRGWSLNSALHSIPDCQAIIKKAAVERLKSRYRTDWFKETGSKLQIRFSILKDHASICLDASGDGLHKRGYRQEGGDAPLKETLAAGMVRLARFYPDNVFRDPFCGSGTILIEAATQAMNIAPGLGRRFAAESWGCIPKAVFSDARSEALAAVQRQPLEIIGSDIDEKSVALTLANAKKAGVADAVRAYRLDVNEAGGADFSAAARGLIVTNPPYGERLLEIRAADALMRRLGGIFSALSGWSCGVISPAEHFESLFGRRADKRRKLYNGMIKCTYYQFFRHYADGSRPVRRAQDFPFASDHSRVENH